MDETTILEALVYIVDEPRLSQSALERKLELTYAPTKRILDELENRGWIPSKGKGWKSGEQRKIVPTEEGKRQVEKSRSPAGLGAFQKRREIPRQEIVDKIDHFRARHSWDPNIEEFARWIEVPLEHASDLLYTTAQETSWRKPEEVFIGQRLIKAEVGLLLAGWIKSGLLDSIKRHRSKDERMFLDIRREKIKSEDFQAKYAKMCVNLYPELVPEIVRAKPRLNYRFEVYWPKECDELVDCSEAYSKNKERLVTHTPDNPILFKYCYRH